MKNGNKRAGFFLDQIKDFRCRTDNRFKPYEHLSCLGGDREVAVLTGTDENYFRILFVQEGKFMSGERGVTIGLFEFFRLFLRTLCHRPVTVNYHIMIVSYIVNLHPPVPCLHTKSSIIKDDLFVTSSAYLP